MPGETPEQKTQRLLADAEKQKNATLEAARRDAETLRKAAQQEGYREGKEAAQKEVTAQAQAQIQRLAEIVDSANEALEQMVRKNEKAIIGLALEIAGKIIKDRIPADENIVVRNAEAAITRAVQKERIKVRVNPKDLLTLRNFQEEFLVSFDAIREILIEEDNRVGPGGCVVETEAGNVEARIDRQLEEVKKTLMEL